MESHAPKTPILANHTYIVSSNGTVMFQSGPPLELLKKYSSSKPLFRPPLRRQSKKPREDA